MSKIRYSILAALLILACGCSWNSSPDSPEFTDTLTPGSGKMVYTGYAPLQHKPVVVHYYIPEGASMANMPILFVFPGTNRNANDYLNAWKTNASYKRVMVFALEFPKEHYSSSQYIEGGMFSGGKLNPEEAWSFSIIEPLFDFIREQTGNRSATYDLWGHSAGAQFVHRMVIFKRDLRLRKAVSSNAGWYTVPDEAVAYPYGLKGSPATGASALRSMMDKPLIVHLGTADIDPNDSSLNTTEGAMKQGPHRYARGTHFFAESQRIATANGITPRWTKAEKAGVAHEFVKMADDAASLLY